MKIENVKVYDLEESIKASKYPMAISTDKCNFDITDTVKRLAQSPKGEAHDQFLSGIRVAFDLTFSNKAWIELERYRFITFVSSQSTMHRITKLDIQSQCNKYVWNTTIQKLNKKVNEYNNLKDNKELYNSLTSEQKIDFNNNLKEMYLEILYNIPSGFELTARLTTNYRCLKGVHSQRKNHRLPEWRKFCNWIETLPYASELIINGDE